jgi:polyisoprenyl-teichoic acid--peptidoglycan teichoic acid transferase
VASPEADKPAGIVPERETGANWVSDLAMKIATGTAPTTAVHAPARTGERGRSPLAAAVLSFVWPGLGQVYARRWAYGALFALPVLVVFGWLAYQAISDGGIWFALAMLDSAFAISVVLVTVAMCVWRVAAMVHAYLVAAPRRTPRVIESGLIAILIAAVVAAHSGVAYLALSVYQFDVDIANNQVGPSSSPSPIAVVTPSPTATASPGTSEPPATPTPNPTATPHKSHHLTIALAGLDWLPGRNGGQYDALMLVSIDTDTHKVAMVSFPRDTAYFDYYWGGRTGINTKLNNFANLVERDQIHAPTPPAGTKMSQYKFVVLGNEMGYLAGISVDYYAVIDMQGFINLVDAAGGVCINVPRGIADKSQNTYIGAGYQCMNGKTALKYARSRHTSNDYVRAGRQQDLIEALARKIASPSGIGRLPKLLSLASKIVQTNFPLNTAKDYAYLIRQVGKNDVTQCVLGPPYSYHPAASLTKGAWTARLKIYNVAQLSVYLFGDDSRYYGMEGITPLPCQSKV